MPPPTLEIERKWLLSAVPRLAWRRVLHLEQGYFGNDEYQLRLRRTRCDGRLLGCVVSRKTGHGLARMEWEEPIDEAVFEMLWPLTEGHRLEKHRQVHEVDDGLAWEIDVYEGHLAGLVTAELELTKVDEEIRIPTEIQAVLVKEVTGDRAYLNSTLALTRR